MVGIYFKTYRLPVQYLIYIAITGLSRHLVIDVQEVSDEFHKDLLLTISGAIVFLSIAIFILTYTETSLSAREKCEPETNPLIQDSHRR